MKIGNQQSYDKSINGGIASGNTSVPWYLCNKNIKDTVSFSGKNPENTIPDNIEQIDINPKADNESCEIKENADGTKTIILKRTHKMMISNKEVNMPVEITTVKEDSNGNRTEAEIVKRSEKNPYEYDIYSYSPNEKPVQTSTVLATENGNMITQTVKSNDGLSQFSRIKKTNGNKTEFKFKTEVSDSSPIEIIRSFEKIDDTHTKSTFNDISYETEFLPDKIVTKKQSLYSRTPEIIELDFKQLDPSLIDLYKQLPGDFFCALKETGARVLLGHRAEQNNACYYDRDNTISMSEELKNNPYAFAHELGHAIDYRTKHYYMDGPLCKDFKAELINFQNKATETEKEIINYFTGKDNSSQNILSELVAESYAITSGVKNTSEIYMLRDVIMQKYFPNTVDNMSRRIKYTI